MAAELTSAADRRMLGAIESSSIAPDALVAARHIQDQRRASQSVGKVRSLDQDQLVVPACPLSLTLAARVDPERLSPLFRAGPR